MCDVRIITSHCFIKHYCTYIVYIHVSVMTSHVFKGTNNVICKCGNTLTNTAGRQMKDCDDPCPADPNQWCGGSEGQQLILSVDGTYVRVLVRTYTVHRLLISATHVHVHKEFAK